MIWLVPQYPYGYLEMGVFSLSGVLLDDSS